MSWCPPIQLVSARSIVHIIYIHHKSYKSPELKRLASVLNSIPWPSRNFYNSYEHFSMSRMIYPWKWWLCMAAFNYQRVKLKGMRSDYTGYQLSNVGCNHPRLVEHQWYMLMIPSTSIHHIKQPKKTHPWYSMDLVPNQNQGFKGSLWY